jgi:DNA-binding transcriptional regulator YdaS (Cro superfamily)
MNLSEYINQGHGTQSQLAKSLDVTPVLIHQWVKDKRQVPAERCLAIEAATSGLVTRYELRPDVFGCDPKTEAA